MPSVTKTSGTTVHTTANDKLTSAQNKTIWSLAKQAGLAEKDLRALNKKTNGTEHISTLTQAKADKLIAALGKLGIAIKSLSEKQQTVAKALDKNQDGRMSRDDFKSQKDFEAVKRTLELMGTPAPAKPSKGPKDTTPKGLVTAHLDAYGSHKVTYQQAFDKAIAALLVQEDGETPRAILKEFADPPMSTKQLDAAIKRIVNAGGLELLPLGEAEESGGEPQADWIFRASVDAGSDHGFWVSVNRDTGEAVVNGFN
jgi:hypothetical protein